MNRLSLIFAASAVFTLGASGQTTQPPAPVSGVGTPTGVGQAPGDAQGPPVVHHQGADVAPDYIISPGDSLEVSVWKEPGVSSTLPVRPDGMISLPLINDIQASGLTPTQLAASVTERLRKFITDPAVTVTVLAVKPKVIYLIGEVAKPGEEPLTPGMSPLQAIAAAGGVTQFTSGKHTYILRGTSAKQQKIPFDYNKAIRDGNLQGVTLQPGDTIVVK